MQQGMDEQAAAAVALKRRLSKRPKPVSFRDVSTIAMVAGKEKKIAKVIHNGVVKEWVGIGWVDLDPATAADFLKFPEVL